MVISVSPLVDFLPGTQLGYQRSHVQVVQEMQFRNTENFFASKVVDIWNRLPEYVVSAPSVTSFKARLDEHWIQLRYGYTQRPIWPKCIAYIFIQNSK